MSCENCKKLEERVTILERKVADLYGRTSCLQAVGTVLSVRPNSGTPLPEIPPTICKDDK